MQKRDLANLLLIVAVSFIVAVLTPAIVEKTITYQELSDANRYLSILQSGQTSRLALLIFAPLSYFDALFLQISANFILLFFSLLITYLATKNRLAILLVAVSFPMSLLLYDFLLSQYIPIIATLILWYVLFLLNEEDRKKFLSPIGILFLAAISLLALLSHNLYVAVLLVLLIVAANRYTSVRPTKTSAKFKNQAMLIVLFCFVFYLIMVSGFEKRISFYYPLIPTIPLGTFDVYFWIVLFLATLYFSGTNEVLFAAILIPLAVYYVFFVSRLEIDFWRIVAFPFLVAFLKLGVNIKKDPIAFTAAFLMLAFGVLRILAAVLFL